MFRGGYSINLDAKGRLALPTRLRDPLQERCQGALVVTIHDDGCLLLYPMPDWEEIERKVMRLPNQTRRTRQLQRMLLGHAAELEVDAQGRILLPPRLREFAKLDKRVVLVAMGHRFEIWNEESWERSCTEWASSADDGADLEDPLRSLTL